MRAPLTCPFCQLLLKSRFGVILGGYGGTDGALVTLCGMQNDCPAWVLETSPWAT